MKYLILNIVVLYRSMNDRKEKESVQRQKELQDEWMRGSEIRHGYRKLLRSKYRRSISNQEVRKKSRIN